MVGTNMLRFPRYRVQTLAAIAVAVTTSWSQPAHSKPIFSQILVHESPRTQVDLINLDGVIAGHYVGDEGQPVFLRTQDGTLNIFSAPEAFSTIPTGLNKF